MTPTDRFHPIERQRAPMPRIVLRQGGGGEPITLDAASLIAQHAVSDTDTLLVLDEDTAYEEQLHLVLVRDDRVIDHIVIGAPYASGVFRIIDTSADTLRFRFENDVTWTLTARPDGGWSRGSLPRGARRRIGLLSPRYLTLDRSREG